MRQKKVRRLGRGADCSRRPFLRCGVGALPAVLVSAGAPLGVRRIGHGRWHLERPRSAALGTKQAHGERSDETKAERRVRPKRSHRRAASRTVAAGVSGGEEKKRAQSLGRRKDRIR
ncbi:hypothetical protein GQ55_9G376400 [Panicum hallii var. hallii]|uniref:Uncharacterized protein n=1 Tax=Panicum hallii var. hallii TaxID=1504633 RepID=A0A2T7C938_9POAL|nr:hypothetical protein GQ55_9G376400 [Panicum hallii var. hallii]